MRSKNLRRIEAYYLRNIEELRKKKVSNAKSVLIAEEGSDDEGRVEIWSIDSEHDEVRKPTHRGCFVARLELPSYECRCLTVQNGAS